MLRVERYADANARVVLNTAPLLLIVLLVPAPVVLTLDDQATMTCWHKTLEDGGKFFGDLLERSLNGLVLDLIQVCNKVFNGQLGIIKLLSPLKELGLLISEAAVLINSLLVDVLVLLQSFIDGFETLGNLTFHLATRNNHQALDCILLPCRTASSHTCQRPHWVECPDS